MIEVTCIKCFFGIFNENQKYFMSDIYHPLDEISIRLKPYSVSYDYSPTDDFSHYIDFSEDDLLEYFDGGPVILSLRRKKKLQNLK